MERLWFSVFFLVFNLFVVNSQYSQSPCPSMFDYQSDGQSIYGVIRLQPNGPVSSLITRVNFTVAARLMSTYVGRIQPVGSVLQVQQFNQGAPITYRVDFPVTSPLPKLTSLTVNDNVLCYGSGDVPRPNQYVSTISLQHMLLLKNSGSSSNQYRPQSKPSEVLNRYPQSKPMFEYQKPGQTMVFNDFQSQGKPDSMLNLIGQFGDTQIFTLEEKGPSGTNFDPFILNNTRPAFDQPPPSQRPQPSQSINPQANQQDYSLNYPEQNSQSERPAPSPPALPPPPELPPRLPPLPELPPRLPTPPELPTWLPPPPELPPKLPPKLPPPPEIPPPPAPTPAPTPPTSPATQMTTTQTKYPAPISRVPSIPQDFQSSGCGEVAGGNEHVPLVFNGQSYARGEWPWLVAIYRRKEGGLTFNCGGTLVSDKHVVTAAHCMQQKNSHLSIRDVVVKLGVYDLEDWGDDITLTRTLASASIHENYNASTLQSDILVFTLDRSVEFNTNIRPACLWSGNADQSRIIGASGVVAGWGRNEFSSGGQGEPRMVRIPVVSTATCRASNPKFHTLTSSKTLCAGDRMGSGPCLGDSGGGLYILESGKWRLRGVVSISLRPTNGETTCDLNEYIVFTDTAQYITWIKGIMTATAYT